MQQNGQGKLRPENSSIYCTSKSVALEPYCWLDPSRAEGVRSVVGRGLIQG